MNEPKEPLLSPGDRELRYKLLESERIRRANRAPAIAAYSAGFIDDQRAKLIAYHCELGRKAAALAAEEGSHLRGLELALEAVRQFTEASRITREGMGK